MNRENENRFPHGKKWKKGHPVYINGHPFNVKSVTSLERWGPIRATGFIGNTLVTGSAQIGIAFHRLAVASRLGRLVHHQDKFTKQALPELCHHLPRNVTGNPWWQIHRMHFSMTAANLECLATTLKMLKNAQQAGAA